MPVEMFLYLDGGTTFLQEVRPHLSVEVGTEYRILKQSTSLESQCVPREPGSSVREVLITERKDEYHPDVIFAVQKRHMTVISCARIPKRAGGVVKYEQRDSMRRSLRSIFDENVSRVKSPNGVITKLSHEDKDSPQRLAKSRTASQATPKSASSPSRLIGTMTNLHAAYLLSRPMPTIPPKVETFPAITGIPLRYCSGIWSMPDSYLTLVSLKDYGNVAREFAQTLSWKEAADMGQKESAMLSPNSLLRALILNLAQMLCAHAAESKSEVELEDYVLGTTLSLGTEGSDRTLQLRLTGEALRDSHNNYVLPVQYYWQSPPIFDTTIISDSLMHQLLAVLETMKMGCPSDIRSVTRRKHAELSPIHRVNLREYISLQSFVFAVSREDDWNFHSPCEDMWEESFLMTLDAVPWPPLALDELCEYCFAEKAVLHCTDCGLGNYCTDFCRQQHSELHNIQVNHNLVVEMTVGQAISPDMRFGMLIDFSRSIRRSLDGIPMDLEKPFFFDGTPFELKMQFSLEYGDPILLYDQTRIFMALVTFEDPSYRHIWKHLMGEWEIPDIAMYLQGRYTPSTGTLRLFADTKSIASRRGHDW